MVVTAQNTKLKPGYKQTEVGVIPADWQVKRLEELGSWKGGGTPSMANASFWVNGTIHWASSGDIKTKILSNTSSMITEIAVKQSSTTVLQEGAILIVTRSGILRKYLPVAKNTVPMAINQDIKALIPNSQISADYLVQILSERGPDILSICMKSGTTVESVEYIWLKRYQIPLPPPPEQRAIATALSDVDALITSLDQLIAKKRDIKQATMQQLLTGKTRLPGFCGELKPSYKQTEVGLIPEDWEVHTLGDEVDQLEAGVSVNSVAEEFHVYAHEQAILKTSAVSNGYFFPHENKKISPRDIKRAKLNPRVESIIISRMNTIDLVGECGYVDKDYPNLFLPDRLWMTRFKRGSKINVKWLSYVLSYRKYKVKIKEAATGTSGSMKNISKDSLLSINIPFPTPNEQTAIATVLSDMDAEIAALEQKRDKTRALKQGMMQELLTGKTRLL
jgi:type I restriction enzyme S subunit